MGEHGEPLDALAELRVRMTAVREECGLNTRDALKSKSGLGNDTLNKAFNGSKPPSETTILALAKALEIRDPRPWLRLRAKAEQEYKLVMAADGASEPPRAKAQADTADTEDDPDPRHSKKRSRQLDAYLRTITPALDAQPYVGVLDGLPPLSAVYLRQRIRCLGEERDGEDLEHRAPAVSSAVPVPADDILAGAQTCVVLAGPGGGKSSLLRTWLAESVQRCPDGEGPAAHVPVLVPASALLATSTSLHGGSLPDALTRAVCLEHGRDFPDLFGSPPRDGVPWLVLIDGVDEIARSEARQYLLRHLAVHTQGPDADLYRFVVATRPLAEGELERIGLRVPRYDLLPFGREELPKVALRWFTALHAPDPAELTERFVTELAGNKQLTDLARIPLIAGLLCQLYTLRGTMPDTRGRIYDEYARLLREQQTRAGEAERTDASSLPDTAELALDIAGHIACRRLRPEDGQDADASLTELLRSWPGPEPQGMSRKEAVLRSGMLTQRAGKLAFLHETFLEYCAARHATRTPEDRTAAMARLFDNKPTRHWPWRPVPDALFATRGQRVWNPPGEKEMSYTGFLLDRLLSGEDAGVVRKKLLRFCGKRDLIGCRFVAEQRHLGTGLPEPVVRRAAKSLTVLAGITNHDRSNTHLRANPDRLHPETDPGIAEAFTRTALRNHRVPAANALVLLGAEDAKDILAELAEVSCLATGPWRVQAAAILAHPPDPDPRGLPLLHQLATDARIADHARVEAAAFMVKYGDEHGVALLHSLARDSELLPWHRAEAVSALAGLGHERSADTLAELAEDAGTSPDIRVRSALMLCVIDYARGPDLLTCLALDGALPFRVRLWVAHVLADFEPPHGVDALTRLADDKTLKSGLRLTAARRLADIDAQSGAAVIVGLAADPSLARRHRRSAARLLR
ncbi:MULTISPECIES: hypothetical protein [unclassified Streptomyces]|uniref:hypothetical protein n=1 Tax=unclassified Streptomyces TaxID=2593676 RepID=UPI003331FF53